MRRRGGERRGCETAKEVDDSAGGHHGHFRSSVHIPRSLIPLRTQIAALSSRPDCASAMSLSTAPAPMRHTVRVGAVFLFPCTACARPVHRRCTVWWWRGHPLSAKRWAIISAWLRSRHVSIQMASAHRRAHCCSSSVEGSVPKLARIRASPLSSSSAGWSVPTPMVYPVSSFLWSRALAR